MEKRTSRIAQDGQTKADPAPDTLFLDINDFADYVAFHRKCDLITHSCKNSPIKMSQKKCRFCD